MPKKSRFKREWYESPQTELPRTRFSIDELLDELLATTFLDIAVRPAWAFLETDSLAFVRQETNRPFIGLSYLLNHPETPQQVMRDILTHELLHLRIPPREIEGKIVSHPPEFWEAQKILIPSFSISFAWCQIAFFTTVDIDREREGVWVHRKRARKDRDGGRPTLEFIHELIAVENKYRSDEAGGEMPVKRTSKRKKTKAAPLDDLSSCEELL